jgi:RNA polymerase primary sigma factor
LAAAYRPIRGQLTLRVTVYNLPLRNVSDAARCRIENGYEELPMKTATARGGGREFEELSAYLEMIREYPPLSRDEEHELALRARRGEVAARRRLVQHNLAFVVAIARKQRRGTVRLDDVIQEGNVGLMRAVEKFDPDAGTRFSTYAVWWIRAYIGKYLKEARSSVRPQSGTVAQADLSLDSAVDDENETTHLERIEDDSPGPEDTYLSSEADGEVRDALGRIRKRVGELGWDIIHNRLQQEQPRTLEEIGKRWGVSRERVRQVELRTKQFLAHYLVSDERDAA